MRLFGVFFGCFFAVLAFGLILWPVGLCVYRLSKWLEHNTRLRGNAYMLVRCSLSR